jgi:hypothetical protein
MAGESLARVERRFLAEETRLRWLVVCAESAAEEPCRKAVIEYAFIALSDAWNRFARDLILASAIGGAVTLGGVRLPKTSLQITNRRLALARVRQFFGKPQPWWEPRWFDPADAGNAATALAIPNSVRVTGAFTASTNPIEDVRWVRNFVAHRGPGTAPRCVAVGTKYGVPDPSSPTQIALHKLPVAPGIDKRLFDIWCGRFVSLARIAAG